MTNAFVNCFKIPELRTKILFTFGMIFIARVGANIPLPGIDPRPLQNFFEAQADAGLFGLYNMFTGGALLNGAVFALGIMPYISASIILQLMGAVVPTLARLQQEGETGRQKITQYTRYLTIAIALVQSVLLNLTLLRNPGEFFQGFSVEQYGSIVLIDPTWFLITSTIFLTAGTVLLMWIGEQITQRGIGNGISLLITIGILADLPSAVGFAYEGLTAGAGAAYKISWAQFAAMMIFLVAVIAAIVSVTQATRKIPVQYAKRMVGRRVMGGQSSFLPLKVNYAGVMPVIFASAILMFPTYLLGALAGATGQDFFRDIGAWLSPDHWFYYVFYSMLILGFSYFWVSIMFKPIQIADELKRNGGYIPGVRPGEPTAKFLDFVMTRLTLAGALFLTLIAILPLILGQWLQIPWKVTQFFGGTGTLIAVGVTLDTMRQIETYLLNRHYDGFLKKGKARNRSKSRTRQLVDVSEVKTMNVGMLWTACGVLLVVGLVSWILLKLNVVS
ncbi:preprotein translocase subunit SecY [Cerasicoccus maritimus]|uniref:preprotein translocase subunit SecY n=1 Tax=Cerasicoccus maritimus TaxID=490089 RepID=UPI0028529C58|nr:preprotein translocase subunit SecY [Cerasicoccus maritimus]